MEGFSVYISGLHVKRFFSSVSAAVIHKYILASFSPVYNENQGTEVGHKKLLGHLVNKTRLATLPSCLSCVINLFTEQDTLCFFSSILIASKSNWA